MIVSSWSGRILPDPANPVNASKNGFQLERVSQSFITAKQQQYQENEETFLGTTSTESSDIWVLDLTWDDATW